MRIDPDVHCPLPPAIQDLIARADPGDHAAMRAAWALEQYGRNGAPLITSGLLISWLEHWETGQRPAIESTGGRHGDNNFIARAALRLAGHLHGPDLQLRDGLHIAVGEQLVVRSDYRPGTADALPAGILLHVTDIDPATVSCTVEIPALGEQRWMSAGGRLARQVTYGYATTDYIEQSVHRDGASRQPERGLTW